MCRATIICGVMAYVIKMNVKIQIQNRFKIKPKKWKGERGGREAGRKIDENAEKEKEKEKNRKTTSRLRHLLIIERLFLKKNQERAAQAKVTSIEKFPEASTLRES